MKGDIIGGGITDESNHGTFTGDTGIGSFTGDIHGGGYFHRRQRLTVLS